MSEVPTPPREAADRPGWLHWPEGPLPAYAIRLLAAVAGQGSPAVPTGSVFCPDGLVAGPDNRAFERAVVALPGDLWPIAVTPTDPRRLLLQDWIAAGASLLVPTRTAAGILTKTFGADRNRCHVASLPYPDISELCEPTPRPEDGSILIDRPIWEALHPYLRALRLAGCRRHIMLVAADAGPQLAPGGDIAMVSDLVPGVEVGATLERGPAVAGAAVIVRIDTAIDAGWELRECLASGRPLVINGEPIVHEHLEAVGATAYVYAGLDVPLQAAEATLAALAQTRGPVHDSARAAVIAESWTPAADTLIHLLQEGDPPRPERRRSPAVVGALSDRPGLRVAVIPPPHRVGSAERFLREIVVELARHPSLPAVTLYSPGAADTASPRETDIALETDVALASSGGRSIDAADEGLAEALAAHRDEIDVVWCTWPHRTLPPEFGGPLVTTFHDLHWRSFFSLSPKVMREIESQMPAWLDSTTLFVSSSEFIRGELTAEYHVAPELTRVVPLTGMRPLPVSREAAEAVRRRFSLPSRFLLFPAGMSPHKNHVALERALEILRAEGTPMTVITTSDQTDIAYHGPDMIGIGYVTDDTLRALYDMSDGLVTPTLYEAGSFPIFEAMMVGKPVACSRIPPIVEQLERDGAEAELFDPNDPTDIAAALSRMRDLGSVERARLIAHNMRAVGRRSWADVADGYMQVFGEAVAARATNREDAVAEQ